MCLRAVWCTGATWKAAEPTLNLEDFCATKVESTKSPTDKTSHRLRRSLDERYLPLQSPLQPHKELSSGLSKPGLGTGKQGSGDPDALDRRILASYGADGASDGLGFGQSAAGRYAKGHSHARSSLPNLRPAGLTPISTQGLLWHELPMSGACDPPLLPSAEPYIHGSHARTMVHNACSSSALCSRPVGHAVLHASKQYASGSGRANWFGTPQKAQLPVIGEPLGTFQLSNTNTVRLMHAQRRKSTYTRHRVCYLLNTNLLTLNIHILIVMVSCDVYVRL